MQLTCGTVSKGLFYKYKRISYISKLGFFFNNDFEFLRCLMMPGLSKGILHPTHLYLCQELSLYKKTGDCSSIYLFTSCSPWKSPSSSHFLYKLVQNTTVHVWMLFIHFVHHSTSLKTTFWVIVRSWWTPWVAVCSIFTWMSENDRACDHGRIRDFQNTDLLFSNV